MFNFVNFVTWEAEKKFPELLHLHPSTSLYWSDEKLTIDDIFKLQRISITMRSEQDQNMIKSLLDGTRFKIL